MEPENVTKDQASNFVRLLNEYFHLILNQIIQSLSADRISLL